jgi:hypothetical protein
MREMPDVLGADRLAIEMGKNIAKERRSQSASGFFERLEHWIRSEENQLEPDEQLLVVYYNRAGESIHVREIFYHNPQLIILLGQDNQGHQRRLLVHMEAVELEIMRVKVESEAQEKRKIGFFIE